MTKRFITNLLIVLPLVAALGFGLSLWQTGGTFLSGGHFGNFSFGDPFSISFAQAQVGCLEADPSSVVGSTNGAIYYNKCLGKFRMWQAVNNNSTGGWADLGGGSESLWLASTDGKAIYPKNFATQYVGIGTDMPGTTLDVVGQLRLDPSSLTADPLNPDPSITSSFYQRDALVVNVAKDDLGDGVDNNLAVFRTNVDNFGLYSDKISGWAGLLISKLMITDQICVLKSDGSCSELLSSNSNPSLWRYVDPNNPNDPIENINLSQGGGGDVTVKRNLEVYNDIKAPGMIQANSAPLNLPTGVDFVDIASVVTPAPDSRPLALAISPGGAYAVKRDAQVAVFNSANGTWKFQTIKKYVDENLIANQLALKQVWIAPNSSFAVINAGNNFFYTSTDSPNFQTWTKRDVSTICKNCIKVDIIGNNNFALIVVQGIPTGESFLPLIKFESGLSTIVNGPSKEWLVANDVYQRVQTGWVNNDGSVIILATHNDGIIKGVRNLGGTYDWYVIPSTQGKTAFYILQNMVGTLDGKVIIAARGGMTPPHIVLSTDGGDSWTETKSLVYGALSDLSLTSDGKHFAATTMIANKIMVGDINSDNKTIIYRGVYVPYSGSTSDIKWAGAAGFSTAGLQQVLTVGPDGNIGTINFPNSAWTQGELDIASIIVGTSNINGVWGSASLRKFAVVGTSGIIAVGNVSGTGAAARVTFSDPIVVGATGGAPNIYYNAVTGANSTLWAVGNGTTGACSIDGGSTWIATSATLDSYNYGVWAQSSTKVWAVGKYIKTVSACSTTASWTNSGAPSLPTSYYYRAIDGAVDISGNAVVVAVGDRKVTNAGGVIVASLDGGANWLQINTLAGNVDSNVNAAAYYGVKVISWKNDPISGVWTAIAVAVGSSKVTQLTITSAGITPVSVTPAILPYYWVNGRTVTINSDNYVRVAGVDGKIMQQKFNGSSLINNQWENFNKQSIDSTFNGIYSITDGSDILTMAVGDTNNILLFLDKQTTGGNLIINKDIKAGENIWGESETSIKFNVIPEGGGSGIDVGDIGLNLTGVDNKACRSGEYMVGLRRDTVGKYYILCSKL
ncbi:MAG: hypothetical protein WC575_00705 [Patescibacteria group bacterium]